MTEQRKMFESAYVKAAGESAEKVSGRWNEAYGQYMEYHQQTAWKLWQSCLAAQPAPQRVETPSLSPHDQWLIDQIRGNAEFAREYVKETHGAAPQPDGAGDVDAIMNKTQEFASAWSLIGTRFDDGGAFEHAETIRAELRAMLAKGM